MPEVENTAGLSISEAFQKGMEAVPASTDAPAPTGSPAGDETPPDPTKPDETNKSDPKTPEEFDKDGKPVAKKSDQAKADPKAALPTDPAKPANEYTKERFDGLMGAWQKDKNDNTTKLERLEKSIADLTEKLEGRGQNKPNTSPDDIEYPPEIANADDDAKAAYRIMMKGVEGKLTSVEKNVLGKVMEMMNAPAREQNEIKTKIDNEISELSVSRGKAFEDNKKEVLEFAAKNNFPIGTLPQAFAAWQREQELTGKIKSLEKGKEIIKEVQTEEDKKAKLPSGSKPAGDQMPVFDPARDGNKTPAQIWAEVAKNI